MKPIRFRLFSMFESGERMTVLSSVLSLGLLLGGVFLVSGFLSRGVTPFAMMGLSLCPCSAPGSFWASFHLSVPYSM
jgi:hypothetical protein